MIPTSQRSFCSRTSQQASSWEPPPMKKTKPRKAKIFFAKSLWPPNSPASHPSSYWCTWKRPHHYNFQHIAPQTICSLPYCTFLFSLPQFWTLFCCSYLVTASAFFRCKQDFMWELRTTEGRNQTEVSPRKQATFLRTGETAQQPGIGKEFLKCTSLWLY